MIKQCLSNFTSVRLRIFSAILLFTLGTVFCQPARPTKLATKLWYWNRELQFSAADANQLTTLGITDLLIRAGQFDFVVGGGTSEIDRLATADEINGTSEVNTVNINGENNRVSKANETNKVSETNEVNEINKANKVNEANEVNETNQIDRPRNRAQGEVRLIRSVKQWTVPPGNLPVTLVFNFTPTMIRVYAEQNTTQLSKQLAQLIMEQLNEAQKAGLNTIGIQLDFDIPSRVLNQYRDLLQLLRQQFPRQQLSITALGDWQARPIFQEVIRQVDFYVPQLYGLEVPRQINQLNTISSPALVRQQLTALQSSAVPFYVGLALYGYALIFDRAGKLQGLTSEISLSSVAKNPDLRLEQSYFADKSGRPLLPTELARYSGENIYRLVAQRDTIVDGEIIPQGYHLVFDVLTGESLRQNWQVVSELAQVPMQGVMLFRYPQPEEELVLTLAEVAAAQRGQLLPPQPKLNLTASNPEVRINHTKVATNKDTSASWVIKLQCENQGAASRFATAAVTVSLQLQGAVWQQVEPQDWTTWQSNYHTATETSIATLARANQIQLQHYYLGRHKNLQCQLRVQPIAPQWQVKATLQIHPETPQPPIKVEQSWTFPNETSPAPN
jgi:hypothetical protein